MATSGDFYLATTGDFSMATDKRVPYPRKELTVRLLRNRCELCEEPGKVLTHQVRSLASLVRPATGQPDWAALMARKRRKTLVVCHPCHETIHQGSHAAATA
jgi:AI2M/AI1M-like, HNH endonuclease